jgi:hypothetical protein
MPRRHFCIDRSVLVSADASLRADEPGERLPRGQGATLAVTVADDTAVRVDQPGAVHDRHLGMLGPHHAVQDVQATHLVLIGVVVPTFAREQVAAVNLPNSSCCGRLWYLGSAAQVGDFPSAARDERQDRFAGNRVRQSAGVDQARLDAGVGPQGAENR